MEIQIRERILMMFKSSDKEMRNLACSLFMEKMDCWKDYEEFRSITWEGRPLIPKHLKKKLRARARYIESQSDGYRKRK